MKIAWCEAGNQGIEGLRFVMSVVLNRVASPDYPNDIHSVIYQPSQFATGGMAKAQITEECHEALAEIEQGNIAPEIVAFEVKTNNFLERYYSAAFEYKDHRFYTKKH